MTGLYLGGVSFQGFEIPNCIDFGGAQRLAIHKLIGGARVIDTLGRDDQALSWAGVLSGPDAADRARSLDAVRVAGSVQPLSWNAFCYSVIVSKLRFQFRSSWWIPYEISCEVQADLAQAAAIAVTTSAFQALTSDLVLSESFLGPYYTQQISSASSLAVAGSAGQNQALAILAASRDQVAMSLESSQTQIQSDNLASVVAAAGAMAGLSCGDGYLARSMANLRSVRF